MDNRFFLRACMISPQARHAASDYIFYVCNSTQPLTLSMNHVLLVSCILVSISAIGQKTKKMVIENEIPEYKEVFYVLVDSPDVKHGEYTRSFKSRNTVSEKGQYRHGKKHGVWTFTDFNGAVEQEIDYSNHK